MSQYVVPTRTLETRKYTINKKIVSVLAAAIITLLKKLVKNAQKIFKIHPENPENPLIRVILLALSGY